MQDTNHYDRQTTQRELREFSSYWGHKIQEWRDEGLTNVELQWARSFWNDFLAAFGIRASRIALFERRATRANTGNTGYIDFHEDDLGRILCNVYALAEGPYLFDSRQENAARRTARVALEYARAYNAGRVSNGNKTLSFDALVKSVRMSMSIAASAEEYEAVLQELHHFDKRGEASVILPSKDELSED